MLYTGFLSYCCYRGYYGQDKRVVSKVFHVQQNYRKCLCDTTYMLELSLLQEKVEVNLVHDQSHAWLIDSGISRHCCHCLNLSAKRISGPDATTRPSYSVVQQYAGLKLASGPHCTVFVSAAQYTRVHERVHLERNI